MIYSGLGPLALVTFLLFLAAGALLSEPLTGNANAFFHNRPLLLGTMVAAAIAVWFLGRWMNRTPLQTTEFGVEGRRVVPKAKHTMYFVRMEYWGPILLVLFAGFVLARG
ncbi:MAG TPA: hypothetical protein VKE69_08635 [Planctomycetota bacterium]|nr:hypothetical protein [Planctomycetota bacterium]